ncbi:MAG: MBL fold metallo-hydrolase [Planctomycetaceae bacterium]|nr:MBL fold metallo-hydrolase [Planctomycetaceae bacterium]
MKIFMFTLALLSAAALAAQGAAAPPERNIAVEKTSQGDLIVQPINHSAVRLEFKGKQYYVDPSGEADCTKMPKADAIFITHEHQDHLNPKVIEQIKKDQTVIYASAAAARKAGFGQAIEPGQTRQVLDIAVEAVAAYNLSPDRQKYHPRDRKDNGYVLTFADKRVYVAGDTEATPEMRALKNIDIAFLPINLPYTMTPAAAADAARAFKPRILYPYHQGKSDPAEVKRLLADVKDIEVRVLPLP